MTMGVSRSAAPGSSETSRVQRRLSWAWVGVIPFFVVATAFMLLPILFLVVGSFQDSHGHLTLQNYVDLTQPLPVLAYTNSIEISLVTAIGGGIFGFLLAYALILGGLPAFLRNAAMTFAGVASNFAGIPLALAFIFTYGQLGLVTGLLRTVLHIDLYAGGFSLYTTVGVELVYMYFQFPLMMLIVAPALDGLRPEWREASENLGASPAQYWRYVALPILTPTLLGTMILLFGNAFGAQATAYELTGGILNLVSVLIGAEISGDVLHNVGLGYAMAVGMIVIMGVAIAMYTLLQRRSERWLR
jgi:putative spermidine/putrescine transport system permease protein